MAMSYRVSMLFVVMAALSAGTSHAATLTYTLVNNPSVEAVDEAASFDLTVGSVTATLTANIGVLNGTTTSFGVNAPGTGDETAQIDGDLGLESVAITFDTNVTFLDFTVSLLSGDDAGSWTIDAGSPNGFTTSGVKAVNTAFTANTTTITISFVNPGTLGNGFSLDEFRVETVAAVPTPAALPAGLGLMGLMMIKRRKAA